VLIQDLWPMLTLGFVCLFQLPPGYDLYLPRDLRWLQAENCDRRLQGTRALMRVDRVSLQSTVVSADCCHIL
ncbi:hypothetical protein D4764_03G0010930, partial [Takifugu flavidus]